MAKVLTQRSSSGKGLVCGFGIYEPRVLCMTDAAHLPKVHRMWRGMLGRTTEKYADRYPSYVGTSVAPAFHRFADFAEWAVRQVGWDSEGFHLDKDLLVHGNRVYSPDTCVFLPCSLNAQLTNRERTHRSDLPIGVKKEKSGRFAAQLNVEDERIRLGMFDSQEDAFAAYKAAKEANYKRLADKYRGVIDSRAFDALMALATQATVKTAEG